MTNTLLAGAILLALAHPAGAQEPAKCASITVEQIQKDAAAANVKLVGGATFHGQNSDEMLVFQTPDAIIAYYFNDGCFVTLQPIDQTAPGSGV